MRRTNRVYGGTGLAWLASPRTEYTARKLTAYLLSLSLSPTSFPLSPSFYSRPHNTWVRCILVLPFIATPKAKTDGGGLLTPSVFRTVIAVVREHTRIRPKFTKKNRS